MRRGDGGRRRERREGGEVAGDREAGVGVKARGASCGVESGGNISATTRERRSGVSASLEINIEHRTPL